MARRIPILTYHAINILGNDYANNDHVALAEDLKLLANLGYSVLPLKQVAQCLDTGDWNCLPDKCVALTCDDGAILDWHDIEHPTCGPQISFANIMRCALPEFSKNQSPLHMTSFVIASDTARTELDRVLFGERHWWHHDWWQAAQDSGLFAIENHSFDHNHDSLQRSVHSRGEAGNFFCVDNHQDADAQIRQAADFIDAQISGHQSTLFAYPYGHCSDYLRLEYFPHFQSEHRVQFAFGTGPGYLSADTDRWNIPRFVCGAHWKNSAELQAILREAN